MEVCVVSAVQSSGSGDVMKEKTAEPDNVVFLEEELDTTHNKLCLSALFERCYCQ